jgi:quercetin dioxygenase-like cupin family protein
VADWTIRLTEDRLGGGAWLALPALNRVLYVLGGEVLVTAGGTAGRLAAGEALHTAGACSVSATGAAATVLRYELTPGEGPPPQEWPGVGSRVLLAHPIALRDDGAYLMRCDRVEFAPGGEARPHGHRGGGIRCLLAGELEVRVGGQPGQVMKPGQAWFESGREPVHAVASASEPTAFVRVSILPRELRGQSSIVYVDPADAAVKPRTYRVFVDEPIELAA